MALHFIAGDGRLDFFHARDDQNRRCFAIQNVDETRPLGTVLPAVKGPLVIGEDDFFISFKTLEAARVMQDALNDLLCDWSKEVGSQSIHQDGK